jgi:gamma-glutamyl phosphate reductase
VEHVHKLFKSKKVSIQTNPKHESKHQKKRFKYQNNNYEDSYLKSAAANKMNIVTKKKMQINQHNYKQSSQIIRSEAAQFKKIRIIDTASQSRTDSDGAFPTATLNGTTEELSVADSRRHSLSPVIGLMGISSVEV